MFLFGEVVVVVAFFFNDSRFGVVWIYLPCTTGGASLCAFFRRHRLGRYGDVRGLLGQFGRRSHPVGLLRWRHLWRRR